MRHLLIFFLASTCYAQEVPMPQGPLVDTKRTARDITVSMSRPVRAYGDISFPTDCKDRVMVDPKAVAARQACRQFIGLTLNPSAQTAFYIWDSTVKDDSLYTVIAPGGRETKKTHRFWWSLFLLKKVKITKQEGMYVAGLPGHTIHWEIKQP